MQYGFPIYSYINRSAIRPVPKNHTSTARHKEFVSQKIQNNLQMGHILGPYKTPPPSTIISPIGLVPKKEEGQYRLIHDLSYPEGDSVNDYIPPAYSTVQYETFDHFVTLLLSLPKGALMAKADIKSAFRILPVRPQDYNLLGFMWDGNFYMDKRMPMGASSSCQAFESLSSALQWILKHLGVLHISHILDDFMFLGPPDSDITAQSLSMFMKLMSQLNIPVNHDKTVHPHTKVIVHGIEVDSVSREALLPKDKLNTLLADLLVLVHKKSVTLKKLQSVLGLLNFATKVVIPGRAFLRRLINLTCGVSKPYHHIKLTQEAKADVSMWIQFLAHYNGKSLLLENNWTSSPHLQLFTDSAKSKGFGLVFDRQWCFGSWDQDESKHNITLLELYPIVLAVLLWGQELSNMCVEFHSDNLAVVEILNSQTSKILSIMVLVRLFVFKCLKHNIQFKLIHVPGVRNIIPDLLSRLQVQKARSLAPHLDMESTPVPSQWRLSNLLLNNSFVHH